MKLDKLDKSVLEQLKNDGRVSYSFIAKKTGTSVEKIKYRIDRLLKEGIILGFNCLLNYEKLGFSEQTIFLKFSSLSKIKKKEAEKVLIENPFTLWVGNTLGEFDFRINLLSQNAQHLHHILKDIESKVKSKVSQNLILTRVGQDYGEKYLSFIYSSTYIQKKYSLSERANTSSKTKSLSLNSLDWKILRELCLNPRQNYLEIAKKFSISGEDVRYHFKKVMSSGIINKFSISVNFTKFNLVWWSLLLRLDHEGDERVYHYIRSLPQTTKVVKYVGLWDVEVSFFTSTIEEADDYLTTLRELYGEQIIDYKLWWNRDSLKFPKVALGVLDWAEKQLKNKSI